MDEKEIRDWKRFISFVIIFLIILWYVYTRIRDALLDYNVSLSHDYSTFPFKTGDLFLTHRKISKLNYDFNGLGSLVKKCFTSGRVEHVGLVYVDPKTKIVYFWELTQQMCRLINLHDFVKQFKYYLCVRPIIGQVDVESFERYMCKDFDGSTEWFYNFHHWYNRFAYPRHSHIPLDYRTKNFSTSRNCAMMVTQTLSYMGIVDLELDDPRIFEVFPSDYAVPHIDRNIIPLKPGFDFADPIELIL